MLQEFTHVFFIEELAYHEDVSYWIDQSLYSLPLIIKKTFYCNPHLLAVITFFNFFETLENHQSYACLSHAMTLYILEKLAKKNIVKLDKVFPKEKYNLKDHYNEFGHHVKEKDVTCYYISFSKLRSFEEQDIPFIESIFKILKIDRNLLTMKYQSQKITLKIKKQFLLNNLIHGKVKQELLNKESYERELLHNYIHENKLALKERKKLL